MPQLLISTLTQNQLIHDHNDVDNYQGNSQECLDGTDEVYYSCLRAGRFSTTKCLCILSHTDGGKTLVLDGTITEIVIFKTHFF